ncbi:MAG: HepT-like ribonuclease domain-containing protein [Chitinophagales bacterium]|nr:DUF86 domain-containing protein [Chitinophagales bacterium]
MPTKEDYITVLSMLQSIGRVFYFTNTFNTADEYFEHNKQLNYLATLTLLSNIGEQSNKLSDNFKMKLDTINWQQIKGLRNFIVHNYEGVDYIILFDTIKNDLPFLKSELENYLKIEIQSNRINKEIFTELISDNPFYKFVDFDKIMN